MTQVYYTHQQHTQHALDRFVYYVEGRNKTTRADRFCPESFPSAKRPRSLSYTAAVINHDHNGTGSDTHNNTSSSEYGQQEQTAEIGGAAVDTKNSQNDEANGAATDTTTCGWQDCSVCGHDTPYWLMTQSPTW